MLFALAFFNKHGGCVALILPLALLGTAMRKVLEYEKQAVECRQTAAQTKNPQLKKRLQDMADVWDRLARERRVGIVENRHDQA
jgi:hypothetical protein